MKKILLFAAAMAFAAFAQAQNYTAQAVTETDPDWTGYDGNILLDEPVTVEAYDDYVVIKGWLGSASQDLKVGFDADENVTSVTPVTEGVEGKTYTSGYAAFNTKASNYYYTQIYLGDGYDYAYSDEEGGYVMLSGYFYIDSNTYLWMYYLITWGDSEVELGELKYGVKSETSVYDDWGTADNFYNPGTEVGVEVYENGIKINGWCGTEGYDLVLQYDENATVTSITGIQDGETVADASIGSYFGAYTGNADLYYVSIYVAEEYNYAFSSADENYVLLSCVFYDVNDDEHNLYYYVEWTEGSDGIHAIATEVPAEYFNLQGQPVANPAKGQILIKRQGDSVTKTLIR